MIIFIIGIILRFYHLNWDEGYSYHPDERNIDIAVTKINLHQLNPHFFAYGAFPIYLIRIFGDVMVEITKNYAWIESWDKITLIARVLSATFSVISIYVFYLIIKLIFNKKMAIFGAFLMATTVGFIQYAHYGVTESLNIFYLLLIIYLTVLFMIKNSTKYWFWMAVIFGLALATKISNIIYIIIPLIAWIILLFKKNSKSFILSIIFPIMMLAIFIISAPFNFLDFDHFNNSLIYERGVATGSFSVPYNLQFTHTLIYLFSFQNLHRISGIIVPSLGFIGILIWLILIIYKKKDYFILPILLFGLIYFIYVGSWHTKFIRYMLPVIPILLIATLWLLNYLLINKKLNLIAKIFIGLMIVSNLLWAYAYSAIYRNSHPWIMASKWIYQNIAPQSSLISEEWDDSLPTYMTNYQSFDYQNIQLKNFEPDNEEKIQSLAQNISKGDYIILASNRVAGAIEKNTAQFPLTNRYYQKLFNGQLGYRLIKTFNNYPKIGHITINDDNAEETFQVYDHPRVRIYQNIYHYSADELAKSIMAK